MAVHVGCHVFCLRAFASDDVITGPRQESCGYRETESPRKFQYRRDKM
jgi:hypothetical protein